MELTVQVTPGSCVQSQVHGIYFILRQKQEKILLFLYNENEKLNSEKFLCSTVP